MPAASVPVRTNAFSFEIILVSHLGVIARCRLIRTKAGCGCRINNENGNGTYKGRITNQFNICLCSHTFSCQSYTVQTPHLVFGPTIGPLSGRCDSIPYPEQSTGPTRALLLRFGGHQCASFPPAGSWPSTFSDVASMARVPYLVSAQIRTGTV